MPLELLAEVESIENVPEQYRGSYLKGEDGKFRLTKVEIEDVSGLKSALQKERDARAAAEKAAKQYEGYDLKGYQEWVSRQEGDEEAQLFNAGKKDELKLRWTGKLQEAQQKEIESLKAAHLKELETERARTRAYESRVLENSIRQAATEVGLHQHAVRDALFQGKVVFALDEKGNAVQKREDGTVVIGKDGKTPFSPKEWLESMRAEAPHWFPASGSGTGAAQSRTTNGSGQKQMTRAEFAKLTPVQQHAFIRKEGGVLVD